MNRFARILFLSPLLLLLGSTVPAPKYGPAQNPRAVPLSQDHDYFRQAPAPDFWALASYYVPQFNDYSCSAAATTMVVNAGVRAGKTLSGDDQNITQSALLDTVTIEHWKELVSPEGYQNRHGLTLSQLRNVTEKSLRSFGASKAVATAIQADGKADSLERFRKILAENERSNRDVVVIHFLQDEVTQAAGGPYAHISPIGAYDAQRRRVLVFDVDRQWYEPYWVADTALWQAMSRSTTMFGKGGYIWVHFDGE